ncbi:MAG: hypothetical protein KKA67_10905 [Spirochaetes bacterium]|nr:hypothetical protein [Spirochaetota bacterium]
MLKRLCGILALTVFAAAAAGAQERIAVIDTDLPKGIDAKVVIPVTEKIMEEFVRSKLFTVLDRSFIAKTLSELEFSTSDLTAGDSDKLATIGGFLKATYIVVSTVQQLDKTYFLSAKMIEVKSGVITAQASVNREGSVAVLIDMAGELGQKLVAAAMGQDSSAVARSSGRTSAPQASAPPAQAAQPAAERPAKERPPKEPKPKAARFSTLSIDVGTGATVGYELDTDFNYYSWIDNDIEAVSGLNFGASAILPIGLLYLSGFGSMTTAEYLGNVATVSSETLALGAGLGLNLLLGPVQAYAGLRAAYMAYSFTWDYVDGTSETYDYSGPGFGVEVGGDVRLGLFSIGLRYAIDVGSLENDGTYPNAEVSAGALALRVGLAF